MKVKKIHSVARASARTIRDHGFLDFGIKSLEYLKKKKIQNTEDQSQKTPIGIKVKYADAIAYPPKTTFTKKTQSKKLVLNWIMPQPGKGSGGHLNIFRFIQYLEKAGHTCNIYLYADGGHGSVKAIQENMGDSYPQVNAKMQWLKDDGVMAPADAIFCTSWETAYASRRIDMDAKKFYFVQDYEPYFYPIGSLYSLAANTYSFGFYGVTAGGWLSKKLKEEHGMKADHYNFGADSETYSYVNKEKRNEIFFYARPYTERRGFEMGILALDIFHKMHPEVVINFAGWDVSNYKIPFPYKNLKTLEISELNSLYNKCAAGLVMSYTNMSLLPLELLASGTIPVVNDGPNNRLVSDNPFIAYSENTPQALAEKLSTIVSNPKQENYAKKASESVAIDSWDSSGKKFISIIEKEMLNA